MGMMNEFNITGNSSQQISNGFSGKNKTLNHTIDTESPGGISPTEPPTTPPSQSTTNGGLTNGAQQSGSVTQSGGATNAKSFKAKGEYGEVKTSGSEIESINKTNHLPYNIIGLPPSFYYEPHLMEVATLNSMPMMEILPGWPKFGGINNNQIGLQLYSVDTTEGETKYKEIIETIGIDDLKKVAETPLRVMFFNDVSIAESWTNDYSESSMEEQANNSPGADTLGELKYIMGGTSGSEGLSKLGDTFFNKGGILGNVFGAAMKTGATGMGAVEGLSNTVMEGSANLVSGSKVDFPLIWKGSTFSPSYSFTIRLYNPYPQSYKAYKETIIYPLARLLALMVPLSDSPNTYSFPLLCRVNCPGLFRIYAGYISSLDLIKGGENNDIAFNQLPGTVDIRLTINELFSTMVAQKEEDGFVDDVNNQRPTLKKYILTMLGEAECEPFYSDDVGALDKLDQIFNSGQGQTANAVPGVGEGSLDPASRVSSGEMESAEQILAQTRGDAGGAAGDAAIAGVFSGNSDVMNSTGFTVTGTSTTYQAMSGNIGNNLSNITGSLSSGINTDLIGNSLDNIGGFMTQGVGGVMNIANSGLDNITGSLNNIASNIPSLPTNINGSFIQSNVNIMGEATNIMNNGVNSVMGGVNNAVNGSISDIRGVLDDTISPTVDRIASIESGVNQINGAVNGGFNNLTDTMSTFSGTMTVGTNNIIGALSV